MRRSLTSAIALATIAAPASAQSGWSQPNLLTALNTAAADTGPHLSIDGTTVHFASFATGNWEIWSSTRAGRGAPWSAPVPETTLNDPAAVDDQPFLSGDGTEIYLSSLRAGGQGGFDVLHATRLAPGLPWSTPQFLTELNGTGSEAAVSLTADGLELYLLTTSHGNPAGNNNSIYKATRPAVGLPFSTPALVTELFTGNTHRDCEVAADGLSIVYTEFDAGVGHMRVFHAGRTSRSQPFGPPAAWAELTNVGGTLGVFSFSRSLDNSEAILAINFAASAGGQELLESRFEGLSASGLATAATLLLRDSSSPGFAYALGAALGNTGFPIDTRIVPLIPDFLLQGTLGTSIPPFTTGFGGALDLNGEAIATMTNPGGFLLGFQVFVGALVWDANAPSGVRTISNSLPVLFQ
jgi:hypothetical protein